MRWLLALFLLLLPQVAHAQGNPANVNPVPYSVWTYFGPTLGDGWAPPTGGGNVTGVPPTVVNDCALWANTSGTALKDGGPCLPDQMVIGPPAASPTVVGDCVAWNNTTGTAIKDTTAPCVLGVPNTTALRALATAGIAYGVFRLSDGVANAPPLFFTPATSPCAVDDGGSCVNSADGNHWVAQFLSPVDARQWGVKPDGATDNHATLQAALTWAAANHTTLTLPAGTIYSSGAFSVTNSTFSLVGQGSEVTLVKLAAGQNFLNITENAAMQSFHLRGMSILAGGTSSGNGVNLAQTGTITNPANTAQSDIENVTFRGADGFEGTDYWTYAFATNYASNINFSGVNFVGPGSANGVGAQLTGGSASNIGVAYNFVNCTFNDLNQGIYYGTYIQGVTVTNGNFTGVNYGIQEPNGTGTAGLSVVNSQFAYSQNGIYYSGTNVTITNSLFGGTTTNSIGIAGNGLSVGTISGNAFGAYGYANTYGIALQGGGNDVAITGNTFYAVANGIVLGAGNQVSRVAGNSFNANVTTPMAGQPNDVMDAPVTGNNLGVTGTASNGGSPNWVRVTTPNAGALFTGEKIYAYLTGGTDPVIGIYTAAVIDATHVDLVGQAWGPAYAGNTGVLSAMP